MTDHEPARHGFRILFPYEDEIGQVSSDIWISDASSPPTRKDKSVRKLCTVEPVY